MNPGTRSNFVLAVGLSTVAVVAGLLILRVDGGEKATTPKLPEPATVAKTVKEADLNVVTLTPEAATRLAVTMATVVRERRPQSRTLPGEVLLPPGRSVVVTAPVPGTIRSASPAKGSTTSPVKPAAAPGTLVAENEAVFVLAPVLTSEARATIATALVDAEGQIRNADVQRKAAAVALARAKQLFDEQAGTRRAVEEAQAAYDVADQTVKAAEARKALLAGASGQSDDGSVSPLVVPSPIAGVLTAVRVAPGQTVSAGSPLFEVVDASQVWVRVSAGASDAAAVAAGKPATVARLGELAKPNPADRIGLPADPAGVPPVGVPLSSTVDLIFKLANPTSAPLNPGERVAVALPLVGDEECLVVPWSAVVYDLHGGAWVYEVVGQRQYARRRVEVRHLERQQAVLRSGPAAGTDVVAQGATELFGREMGFAK